MFNTMLTKTEIYISEILNGTLKKSFRGCGVFSKYYQLSRRRGIKILRGRYKTIERAKLSMRYVEAHSEVMNLKIAKDRYFFVPKCYGVKIVKIKNTYSVGILMEHLGKETLEEYSSFHPIDPNRIVRKLYSDLKKVKITHDDLHNLNVMYHKYGWYAIDFGKNGIRFL